ncbi:NAD(P)/FAD-dependent oxidoreductase [Larsenimonas rhizosphaerae]|uniref:FAD-dependent oxidoreductase n=1 Tax=Larsenimonas rhizosphaerae TaxID=2944682 RepID=A0AA42CYS7_9GAMM|nr:FAD-dependent oxidoreductase [Larsenimonas rhizosphaerae]MCM2132179.1 FAD-dependent oxidoreductase [Larsenimonas rhizosphaerae]MCX2525515.1 FAD-dependent oxidoreductase [Larsenimonas rhizosphaerae]
MMPVPPRIAIIGAGLSGLSAATTLAADRHSVQVFDKARGPGGRLASRHDSEGAIDLGAPCFTARSDAFKDRVAQWLKAGVIAPWPVSPWTRRADGQLTAYSAEHPRYAATPRMSALTRHLAGGLDITLSTRITSIERIADEYWLTCEGLERYGPFGHVVLALPAPQAQALLPDEETGLLSQCNSVTLAPSWHAHYRLDAPLDVPWDALFFENGTLYWASRQESKPGRESAPTLRLIATPEWSQQHLELAPEDVACRLKAAFIDMNMMPRPAFRTADAHRWRFAQATHSLSRTSPLWNARHTLALCGDWCAGNNVEAAWLAGQRCASELITYLTSSS